MSKPARPKRPFSIPPQAKLFFILLSTSLFFLTGCGGGSDDTVFLGGKTDINVALSRHGGSASATYNLVSAAKVNDGDTGTSEYWSGNIVDDAVTIDFGRSRFLKEVRIYTNEAILNPIVVINLIELSINGNDWLSTAQTSGSDISCQTLLASNNQITCTYSRRQEARFLRFTTKRQINPGLVNVYELEAIGY